MLTSRILMADVFGESISGWSMGLLSIRSAMVAAAGIQAQVWFWAARQAGAFSEFLYGVGVLRLQPTRHRVLVCRPSSRPME